MARKKKQLPKSSTDTPPDPPSDSDADKVLAEICTSTELDEISFDTWNSSHTDLDLTVPLWVKAPDAAQGGNFTVSFSRTFKDSQDSPSVRHPASCVVTLPAGVVDGAKISVKGQGDRMGDLAGDLIVVVRLRK